MKITVKVDSKRFSELFKPTKQWSRCIVGLPRDSKLSNVSLDGIDLIFEFVSNFPGNNGEMFPTFETTNTQTL